MRLAARAGVLREAARAALLSGGAAQALAMARAAYALEQTPRASRLLALALIAGGDAAGARTLITEAGRCASRSSPGCCSAPSRAWSV
jgi:hypothetical protein